MFIENMEIYNMVGLVWKVITSKLIAYHISETRMYNFRQRLNEILIIFQFLSDINFVYVESKTNRR